MNGFKSRAYLALGSLFRRFGRTSARFRKNTDGAYAIEFGIVAVPFIGLTMAIIEASLAFFAGQVMETALRDAARTIRTGQAQAEGVTATSFKCSVCNRMSGVFDCAGGLHVDVRSTGSFGGANFGTPGSGGNFDPNQSQFNPGAEGSVVVARVFYHWPVFSNVLGGSMANQSNGTILLQATTAFRNEPFGQPQASTPSPMNRCT
jgi:Flp pilus assembly protein TadG